MNTTQIPKGGVLLVLLLQACTPAVTAQNTITNATPAASAGATAPLPSPVPSTKTPPAATSQEPSSSTSADTDGLAVVIRPAKTTFKSDEPLAVEVTYRNVSTASFRLPGQPDLWGDWQLKVVEVNTGKTYTGQCILPGFTDPNLTVKPSGAIPPGKTLTTTADLEVGSFGFIEGTLDFDAFRNAAFDLGSAASFSQRRAGTYLPPLPVGTYKVRVNIRFPNEVEPDADPVPVWKDRAILSNPVEIKIVAP